MSVCVCGDSCTNPLCISAVASRCIALTVQRGGAICCQGSRSHRGKPGSHIVAKPTIFDLSSSAKRPKRPHLRTRAPSPALPTPRKGDNTPDHQRLARIVESLSGQVQAPADAGGRDAEGVGVLEQTARSIQEPIRNLAQRQAAGAGAPKDQLGSNSLTNKAGFKPWSQRHKLVAGAKGEKFKTPGMGRSMGDQHTGGCSRDPRRCGCAKACAARLRQLFKSMETGI